MERVKKVLIGILIAAGLFGILAFVYFCTPVGREYEESKTWKSFNLKTYGNVLAWDEQPNAEIYQVYANDELVLETHSTYAVLNNLTEDSTVQIAKVEPKTKFRKHSLTTKVYKTAGFASDEQMSISLSSDTEYDIAPSIRYVEVSGSAQNVGITIDNNRNADLIIKLKNVSMLSGKNNNCIRSANNELSTSKAKYSVILIVEGNNTLTGQDQTGVPAPQTETNSGKAGTPGESGRTAIVVPQLIVCGSGKLNINGGKGGDGGDGAPSSGAWATFYGDGGDGGDGGYGIKCNTMVLAMDTGGKVASKGAAGGKGGRHGVNGNMLTGALGSVTSPIHNGDDGSDGKPIRGDLIIFGGSFN